MNVVVLSSMLRFKLLVSCRDVGSISNLGGAPHFKGTSYLKKKGAFPKNKRAPLCLLQNLGGMCPQYPLS